MTNPTHAHAICDGIATVSRHYPAFAPKDDAQLAALVQDYTRELAPNGVFWPAAGTILEGFRRATVGAGSFSPKYADILRHITTLHRDERRTMQLRNADGPDTLCPRCGTTTRYEEPDPHGHFPPRLWIAHRDDCALRRPTQSLYA